MQWLLSMSCGKLDLQRVLVAMVAKVANLICEYLVINVTYVCYSVCKGCKISMLTFIIERLLVEEVAKYIWGKLDVHRVLVAVIAKVANQICDYLEIKRCW